MSDYNVLEAHFLIAKKKKSSWNQFNAVFNMVYTKTYILTFNDVKLLMKHFAFFVRIFEINNVLIFTLHLKSYYIANAQWPHITSGYNIPQHGSRI